MRYTLRCALDGAVNTLGFIIGKAGHELEFARGERGLCAYVLYALSTGLGSFNLRGNAKHALKRVHEQDRDESGLQMSVDLKEREMIRT